MIPGSGITLHGVQTGLVDGVTTALEQTLDGRADVALRLENISRSRILQLREVLGRAEVGDQELLETSTVPGATVLEASDEVPAGTVVLAVGQIATAEGKKARVPAIDNRVLGAVFHHGTIVLNPTKMYSTTNYLSC